jgi:hypothetical protein
LRSLAHARDDGVADAGREHVRVIIAPNDLRVTFAPVREDMPLWVVTLYRSIAAALADFPAWLESDRSIDVLGMSKVQAKR